MLYKFTVFLLFYDTKLCIPTNSPLTVRSFRDIIIMLGKFCLLSRFRQDSQELSVRFVNFHMEIREITVETSNLRIEVFSHPWYNSNVPKEDPYN